MKTEKPLKRKAYGSIPHLPSSRLGPSDSSVTPGQARICETQARDKHDLIVVQEKLDGSNVSVARIDGEIYALVRAGYLAQSSRFEQHQLFAYWVRENEWRFRTVLNDGERLCGEWLAQAHGTIYTLGGAFEPFAVFDLIQTKYDQEGNVYDRRLPYNDFVARVGDLFCKPTLLHIGGPITVEHALTLHGALKWPCDEIEGIVYRVERHGEVDFLAKYVRPDKIDGKYLFGNEEIWNWRP